MYKSIIGNNKAGEKIASNNSKVPEELLHRIVEEIEDLKRNGGGS